jgi:predicted AlkP superfamily phosphohydrolase/phosphomutase
MIAGFPIVNETGPTTHPRELAESLKADFPHFQVDVPNFRNTEPQELLSQIHSMTNTRFELAQRWIAKNDWALFMMVEMGPDRLHHAFWDFAEPEHPHFTPDHPLQFAIRDYYILLDKWVGKLTDLLNPDDLLMIVSDHGAQTMQGGLALNQWLIDNGYLTLLESHPATGPLQIEQVDWTKTKAWADGGYVGRIYFNQENREPQGWLSPEAVTTLHHELRTQLNSLQDLQQTPLNVEVLNATEAYGENAKGIPPDLTIMVNDLGYRVLGSVGHSSWISSQNDTGRDGANHAHQGIFVGYGLKQAKGHRKDLSLYDVAPTALRHLGLSIPDYMVGNEIN